MNALYERIIATVERASKTAEVSMPTANKITESLQSMNILDEITGDE